MALTKRTRYEVLRRDNHTFMGICWKKITVMQETAKQLLAAEDGGA